MDAEILWELFYMTGEPLAYALYREAVEAGRSAVT